MATRICSRRPGDVLKGLVTAGSSSRVSRARTARSTPSPMVAWSTTVQPAEQAHRGSPRARGQRGIDVGCETRDGRGGRPGTVDADRAMAVLRDLDTRIVGNGDD